MGPDPPILHTMSEQKDRMLRGDPYLADDPELVADRLRCQGLVERFNAITAAKASGRRDLLEELLARLGVDAEILPPFRCDYGFTTMIGDRTFINYGAVILDCAPVTIGSDVQVGPGVQILTATHPLDAEMRRARWESALPITIGDGAWLGGGVIVCPGVSIGEQAVIGAGSVVTRDIPPRVLAVGSPCKVVRPI
jgi:maltose O-acetyltransferase